MKEVIILIIVDTESVIYIIIYYIKRDIKSQLALSFYK